MKREKWNHNDIPDQTGRVAVIAESNSGIGLEIALVLARCSLSCVIVKRLTFP